MATNSNSIVIKRILGQLSESDHALLNNGGFEWNLFRLNLGFRFIIDVQVLPTPRLWLRLPYVGEILIGLTQLEVCKDSYFEPDYIVAEAAVRGWGDVTTNDKRIWEQLPSPELTAVSGNPKPLRSRGDLLAWGMPIEEAIRLCEDGEVPTLLPRRLNRLLDSVNIA
jgi:hypothetical protein